MNIEHTDLGITSKDIGNETDKSKLLKWKQVIEEDIVAMEVQIENAKDSDNPDKNWLKSVRTKKRLYGALNQKIQLQLAIVKANHQETLENEFMDVCRRELPDDKFWDLKAMAEANIEFEKQQEQPKRKIL